MRDVWIPLLLTSAGAAIAVRLIPRRAATAKTVRMAAALCLLVCLLSPLAESAALLKETLLSDPGALADRLSSLQDPGDVPLLPQGGVDADSLFENELTSLAASNVETWVQSRLRDTFGISPDHASVTVSCSSDGQSLRTEGVWIVLRGRAVISDPHVIEAWFSERLGCPCAVSVG